MFVTGKAIKFFRIHRAPNVEMQIKFDRKVNVDCLKVYLREDFLHDLWLAFGPVTVRRSRRGISYKTKKPLVFYFM